MGSIVAVDIGGTHLRAAVYQPEQIQPNVHQRVETRANEPGVFDRLVTLLKSVWPKDGKVDAIGVATPGPLDPHTGYILATPNIKEWQDFPLGPNLSRQFNVPAFINNDAKLAGLAEWKFGAGKGHHHVLYLTVSTGVGAGVISNDQLLQGYRGLATELGHTVVDPDGPMCSCGYPGHLEAYSSGPAIVKYVLSELEAGVKSSLNSGPDLSAFDVAEAARAGDQLSKAAYLRAGKYLGIAVAGFLHAFNPSILIFGGGVSQVGSLLFEPFQTSLHERVFHPRYLENLVIATAALGDDAGLLGALALAQISLQPSK